MLEWCDRLGVVHIPVRSRWVTVLAYHRVCDCTDTPWDPDVISATPAAFDRQMAFVRKNFTPIGSSRIIRWLHGSASLPRNPIIVTFDDGYRDNHDVALPILRRQAIPADFFVCPWYIENRRLFWWDRIAFCLKKTDKDSVELTYPSRMSLRTDNSEAIEASRHQALHIVKHTPRLKIERFVGGMERAAEIKPDEEKRADELIMTWDQVRALRDAGMGIGSHSFSHPVLPMVDQRTVSHELTRSRFMLESRLGEPVQMLAFPVGSFREGTKELAQRAGYDLAYSYSSGASFLGRFDPYEVRRLAVERHHSLSLFRARSAMPFLAG